MRAATVTALLAVIDVTDEGRRAPFVICANSRNVGAGDASRDQHMRTTNTATIELDPRGLVITRIHEGASQSLADASENLAATVEICEGARRALLVDISRCQPLEPEVRHFYSGEVLVASFVALALQIEASPLGRMMGNVYLKIARPGIPTQLFTDRESAVRWLLTQAAP